METYFNYTDDIIRSVIPNIQLAVSGENPWVDKLNSFIIEAENFVDYWIAPLSIIDKCELQDLACQFIIWRAWSKAVNILDLVLTPNGFAVVSNQTLAPASKERVAAALNNAVRQADSIACRLLDSLRKSDFWLESEKSKFYDTLFPNLNSLDQFFLLNDQNLKFFYFLKNRYAIRKAEKFIALNYISSDVLKHLRILANDISLINNVADHEDEIEILNAVRKAVAFDVNDPIDHISYKKQCELIIRLLDNSNSELSDVWRSSLTYRVLTSKPFCNEKNSSAYFF